MALSITSGTRRGVKLQAPPRLMTRPTSQRARQALGDTLAHHRQLRARVRHARSLADVFAGSGGVALELLSRFPHLEHAWLCDKHTRSVLIENVKRAKLEAKVTTSSMSARLWAQQRRQQRLDLVFLDPPYAQAEQSRAVLDALHHSNQLSADALCILQSSPHAQQRPCPPEFEIPEFETIECKTYGNTRFDFLLYRGTTSTLTPRRQLLAAGLAALALPSIVFTAASTLNATQAQAQVSAQATSPEATIDAFFRRRAQDSRIPTTMVPPSRTDSSPDANANSSPNASPNASDDSPIIVFEFFDYNCGFCRAAYPFIQNLIARTPQLRLAWVEWPIFGPDSEHAARVALAAHAHGAYDQFHHAFMTHNGPLTTRHVESIAHTLSRSLGIDKKVLDRARDDPETEQLIRDNHQEARALGLRGTPSFVNKNRVIAGLPRTIDDLLT